MRLIQHRKFPLLPRLSTLCSIPYGPVVWSILSPTLRSFIVDVFLEADIPAVSALMDALGDIVAFPRLEKFHLEAVNMPPWPLRALSRMTNLRQLSIFGPDIANLGILVDLSTLPYLEDLMVQFEPDATFVTHPEFPLTPFVALKSLGIEAPALFLDTILVVLPVAVLQSLTIKPLKDAWVPESDERRALWTRYFQIISSRFSASMTTLVVECDVRYELPPESVSISLFEPLFEMRKLQKVDLSEMQEVISMSNFGDQEFFRFASAWPAIQELDLPAMQTTATIRTLQSFATECPRLRHLQISFDVQAVEETTLPMTSSPLEMLMVGETPMPEDEVHLARNLDRLFPSLQAVCYASATPKEWDRVGKLVRAFRAVRAEERARCENCVRISAC